MTAAFLSISDLCARWSCSRAFVYRALNEMETSGYLRRFYVGADQRVAVGSVEEFERRHAAAPGASRGEVAAARGAATKARRRTATPSATAAPGLREQWRRMRSAA